MEIYHRKNLSCDWSGLCQAESSSPRNAGRREGGFSNSRWPWVLMQVDVDASFSMTNVIAVIDD